MCLNRHHNYVRKAVERKQISYLLGTYQLLAKVGQIIMIRWQLTNHPSAVGKMHINSKVSKHF